MTESKRPLALTIAVILVWLEAAASLIYGALQALNLVFQGAKDIGGAVSVIVFFILIAAWLFFSATKLLTGARWARNAILFWQFMQIAVASATFDSLSGNVPVNIPVGILGMSPAIAIIVLLFTKKVMKLTVDDRPAE
jgi:hypothetical protein